MSGRIEKSVFWLIFLFGWYYYCLRVTGLALEYTPGDYLDSRFINYVLEHGYRWLLGKDPNFWRANFMHPLNNNIAISDCMAGVLPIYAFFRALQFDSEQAYQLWWISCSALNFLSAAWAFRKMGFNLYSAAIGAYIFAFGIGNLNQFMHLQMNCKFFIPLVIVQFYLFQQNFALKHYVFALLALVFQFYSNVYLFIFLCLFLVLLLIPYLLSEKRYRRIYRSLKGRKLLYMVLMLLPFAALIYLVAEPYYRMNHGMSLPYSYIAPSLPWFYSYFLPHENVLSWHALKFSPIKNDAAWYIHDLFPGALVYLALLGGAISLFLLSLRKPQKLTTPAMLFIAVALMILLFSRTHDLRSLFRYFQHWPGFSNMRLPARFMAVAVFACIWMGLWWLKHSRIRMNAAIALLLFVLVFIDNRFEVREGTLRTTSAMRRYRTEAMKELILQSNTKQNRMVAVINTSNDDESFQLDVMLATQELNLETFNGYSSTCIGELCFAFHDKDHIKLRNWLRQHWIDESKVTFIHI